MTTMTPPTGRATTDAAPHHTAPTYDWREYAACATADPEAFFPQGPQADVAATKEYAKRVCARCPVTADCLDWALATGQTHGIWGGLDESERSGAAPVPVTQLSVCLDNRKYIESRLASGASMRSVAGELNVGPWAVRDAVAVFRAERAAAGERAGTVGEVQAA